MTASRPATRLRAALLTLVALLAACGTTAPSGSPASEETQPAPLVLGCIGVGDAECRFLGERVVNAVAGNRGTPFSVTIQLFGCDQLQPCPETLDARQGQVTVEWADGGEPVSMSLGGTPMEPSMAALDIRWSGPHPPASLPAPGPGPFPFDLGHCGLTWKVDFDGSFWVPLGQVDGDASGLFNAESGQIRLIGRNLAEFAGAGWSVQLARFPGPKHVWVCR